MTASPGKRSDSFAAMVLRQPENELFRFSLAQAFVAENRLAEAIEHYQFCIRKKADWMMPRILLGKVYLQLGRRIEARIELTEALRLAVAQSHEDPERELCALLEEIGDDQQGD